MTAIIGVRTLVTRQGAVRIRENSAYICWQWPTIVAIYVDLESKHAEYLGDIYEDGEPPTICLDDNEETLHIDESKEGESTLISFPDFVGWTVFSAHVSSYTLSIVLVKQTPAHATTNDQRTTECDNDDPKCECAECNADRVVNLRTALIDCVMDRKLSDEVQQLAIDRITHSYGGDSTWLDSWG